MPRVILSGHIVVPGRDLDLVLQELPNHIEQTRKESGCLIFNVNQDPENPNVFHVYEEFLDQGAFEAHQLRVTNSNWGRIAAGVQRHYEISHRS
ncbi:putative quinol monooxygenase [Marinobacter sp. M1N3S26]|uniref:putative quinol monooxygenase n=1 Tax=unclassified Marinobacter TaxID=83889 RepID=UPI00387B7AC2